MITNEMKIVASVYQGKLLAMRGMEFTTSDERRKAVALATAETVAESKNAVDIIYRTIRRLQSERGKHSSAVKACRLGQRRMEPEALDIARFVSTYFGLSPIDNSAASAARTQAEGIEFAGIRSDLLGMDASDQVTDDDDDTDDN